MSGHTRSSSGGRGTGECHCVHVTKLQEDMADLKAKIAHFKASFGAKPFSPGRAEAPPPSGGR